MDEVQIYIDESAAWRWRRVAPNGEIISVGESYTRQADAMRAAERVHEGIDVDYVVPEHDE